MSACGLQTLHPLIEGRIRAIMLVEGLLSALICVQVSSLRNSKMSGYVFDGNAQTKEKNSFRRSGNSSG